MMDIKKILSYRQRSPFCLSKAIGASVISLKAHKEAIEQAYINRDCTGLGEAVMLCFADYMATDIKEMK